MYKPLSEKIADKDKKSLKKTIKKELEKIGQNYTNTVSEEDHIKNIETLSREITKEHGEILKNGQLRIGTAQKLLNVYIKFLWSLNPEQIKNPIHCPLDRIVLKKIGCNDSWTMMERIDEYEDKIDKIRNYFEKKGINKSIAEWERDLWNEEA